MQSGWVNVVSEHPRNGDLLFVGTEIGVFVSFDRGASWARMTGGFPTVPVDDLVIHPRDEDLIVGTHGRSIYILDDIGPLARYRSDVSTAQLFAPRDATMFLPWKHESYGAQGQYVGENPTAGAIVTYHLPNALDVPATLTVRDEGGAKLRLLEGSARKGFNRVVWDLRAEGPEGVTDGRGPFVPTGTYTFALEVGAERLDTTVRVDVDPRMDIGAPEFRARYQFLVEVNALRERVQRAVNRADSLEREANKISEILEAGDEDVRTALKDLEDAVAAAKEPLAGTRSSRDPTFSTRATRLFTELSGDNVRQGTLHGPTEVQRARLTDLNTEADEAIAELEAAINTSVPEINRMLQEKGPLQLK